MIEVLEVSKFANLQSRYFNSRYVSKSLQTLGKYIENIVNIRSFLLGILCEIIEFGSEVSLAKLELSNLTWVVCRIAEEAARSVDGRRAAGNSAA